jgi:predicted nucleic acid-binding protein
MPNKIFFDANLLVDLINVGNTNNKLIVFLVDRLLKSNKKLYCSPTTFSITYYFLGKILKNKNLLNEKIKKTFSVFYFTREDNLIMEKVQNSMFRDLEDALQYFSAEDSGIDAIITYNYFDFEHSEIPVYHPLEYISKFLL